MALAATSPAVIAAPEVTTKTETTVTTTEKQEAPLPGSIFTVIRDGQNFSILAKAVKAAELESTFGAKGAWTVFAPTDEAFSKLPSGVLASLMLPENKEKLRTLLMYHVIAGSIPAATFVDGKLKTAGGDSVEIDVDGNNEPIEVNDAKIVNADQTATNGVVHVIDKVLVPKSLEDFKGLAQN